MDIIWHGHSCFTLKGDSATVIVDPYDGLGTQLPALKGDIVTYGDELAAKEGARHEVKDARVLDWPGEFEVSGVAIESFSAEEHAKEGGAEGDDARIFIFAIDGIKICHLSGLTHELSDTLLEHIGDVDILLVPVGGSVVLDGKRAHTVVDAIEPRLVIPMYYSATESKFELGGAEEFLKSVGKTELTPMNKYSVKGKAALPEGVMEFIKLEPQL